MGRAKWWHFEMEVKIDAQSRMDPKASLVVDGGEPVLSAWVAEERNRVSGQESTEMAERAQAEPVLKAVEGEVDAWKQFKVYLPAQMGTQTEDVVDTRWPLSWKEVDGKKTVRARRLAKRRMARSACWRRGTRTQIYATAMWKCGMCEP